MASRFDGPLSVFRISDIRHQIFDGAGAYLHGARWTSSRRRVIYAAETYAGAMLEILVHLSVNALAVTHSWIEIEIPRGLLVEEVRTEEIPNWNSLDYAAARRYGDSWHAERRSAVLLVPSVVTGGVERNVLINSEHSDFPKISCGAARPVYWDERLFKF